MREIKTSKWTNSPGFILIFDGNLVCKKGSLNSINQYLRSGEPQTLDLIPTTIINSEKTVINTKTLVKSPTLSSIK